MTVQQLQQRAKDLQNQMEWLRDDYLEPLRVIIRSDALNKELLLQLIDYVNENATLSMNSTYRFIMEALSEIADADLSDVEEQKATRELFTEVSNGMEADVYTSDLTNWLAEDNNHIYYLTQMLEDFSPKDGFEALAGAQLNAKVDALDRVLDWLVEHQEALQ